MWTEYVLQSLSYWAPSNDCCYQPLTSPSITSAPALVQWRYTPPPTASAVVRSNKRKCGYIVCILLFHFVTTNHVQATIVMTHIPLLRNAERYHRRYLTSGKHTLLCPTLAHRMGDPHFPSLLPFRSQTAVLQPPLPRLPTTRSKTTLLPVR